MRDADHLQRPAGAEAQPLHDHDVGVAADVLGFGERLISRLAVDAQRLRILHAHIFDADDLLEQLAREVVFIAGDIGTARHRGDEHSGRDQLFGCVGRG